MSSSPSSRSNSQARVCLARRRRCRRFARATDDPLQGGELLVEVLAEPRELIGLAEIRGVDDLVEGGAVGVVGETVRHVAAAVRRVGGFARHLGIVGAEVHRARVEMVERVRRLSRFVLGRIAHLHAFRGLRRAGLRLSRLALVERAAGIVVLELGIVGILLVVRRFVGKPEVLEQAAQRGGECPLVLAAGRELGKVRPDPDLELGTPQLVGLAGGGRRLLPGERLPGEKTDHLPRAGACSRVTKAGKPCAW